jgi:hypothetical protein
MMIKIIFFKLLTPVILRNDKIVHLLIFLRGWTSVIPSEIHRNDD